MPTNYNTISTENLARYGWDIERIGKILLADRYADRTHFVFELLQNAEDAIGWRPAVSTLPKSVLFDLHPTHLDFSHFGLPFEERHVRAICGIAESTKENELTAIGRFGIGFKSVYAFTNRPEIHSGDEHFAIDAFVRPCPAPPRSVQAGQTLFHLPFADGQAFSEILQRLRVLGHRTLLFLKQIESIEWKAAGTNGGTYLRDSKPIAPNLRQVTLVGQPHGSDKLHMERWLVFSRDVFTPEGKQAGQVEVAYALVEDPASKKQVIKSVTDSCLVVFFPTEKETHLGFLVQGPYQTTPSRDNVPAHATWNQHLVKETAALVQDSLRQSRDLGYLNVGMLTTMPLDAARFNSPNSAITQHMFKPVFLAVKDSLTREELLPKHGGGFVPGNAAKLARTDALRKLFAPRQLADLYGVTPDLHWLSDAITRDKTPELRDYLITQVSINEVEPDTILTRFTPQFIQKQSDDWVAAFYAFLLDQPALWRYGGFRQKSIIRLESGAHVTAFDEKNRANAFLPGAAQSGFPTVKAAVCKDPLALKFLQQLGLTEPDPVDDVIVNVLPPFATPSGPERAEAEYTASFARIQAAFQTDSSSRREKLVGKLTETHFVRCRNAKTGDIRYRLPGAAYFPADRLAAVFRDCPEIWFVDDVCAALKGEAPRKLLEACGVRDYLRRIAVKAELDWQEELALRRTEGHVDATWGNSEDYDVEGLASAAKRIASLPFAEAEPLASILWQLLLHTLREARESFFQGSYTWGYYQGRWTAPFPAKFIKALRSTAWLPAPDQTLKLPAELCFSALPKSISGSPSPALQALLGFKPEVIQQLADQVGVDPSVLDLVKKHGLTEEKLRQLLQQAGLETKPETSSPNGAAEAVAAMLGPDAVSPNPVPAELQKPDRPAGADSSAPGADNQAASRSPAHHQPGGKNAQSGKFLTYVYTDPNPGPDGHPRSTAGSDSPATDATETLGREGVAHVLAFEKTVGRNPTEMPQTHEGYDVESRNAAGQVERYIEVKTTNATWGERGVALSQPQFAAAQRLQDKYWLYVVDDARSSAPRIHRVQNPALKVQNFAFDCGWQVLEEPTNPTDAK